MTKTNNYKAIWSNCFRPVERCRAYGVRKSPLMVMWLWRNYCLFYHRIPSSGFYPEDNHEATSETELLSRDVARKRWSRYFLMMRYLHVTTNLFCRNKNGQSALSLDFWVVIAGSLETLAVPVFRGPGFLLYLHIYLYLYTRCVVFYSDI